MANASLNKGDAAGDSYDSIGVMVSSLAVNAGGWSSEGKYPRDVADVNGDGYADMVGFV